MTPEDRLRWTASSFERYVYTGDTNSLDLADRDLDAVEADLAVTRGRILHARFFETSVADAVELARFQRATRLYRLLDNAGGEAESMFWEACFHQVSRTTRPPRLRAAPVTSMIVMAARLLIAIWGVRPRPVTALA